MIGSSLFCEFIHALEIVFAYKGSWSHLNTAAGEKHYDTATLCDNVGSENLYKVYALLFCSINQQLSCSILIYLCFYQ